MDDLTHEALFNGGVIDITTTGRKTGEPRRIEIVFHNLEGRFYISGLPRQRKRDWLANLEAKPRFMFHLKQGLARDIPAVARPITEEAERREVLTRVARAWNRDDIDAMVSASPLVEVILEGY